MHSFRGQTFQQRCADAESSRCSPGPNVQEIPHGVHRLSPLDRANTQRELAPVHHITPHAFDAQPAANVFQRASGPSRPSLGLAPVERITPRACKNPRITSPSAFDAQPTTYSSQSAPGPSRQIYFHDLLAHGHDNGRKLKLDFSHDRFWPRAIGADGTDLWDNYRCQEALISNFELPDIVEIQLSFPLPALNRSFHRAFPGDGGATSKLHHSGP
ncbi:hypothetical protein M413DRAFT_31166 [Hebeloma cylindrosporum]|uniref:Uncharacterized protein n=1 Tax=Hebeloma cylindrosporum TaxID=76867 RepID=A0A0C3BZX1_HEBCY|nr:hypothetical protein M413DRAFT_31166 [Hebeloma cylindrosporum h7]